MESFAEGQPSAFSNIAKIIREGPAGAPTSQKRGAIRKQIGSAE
jgi:hypothetical protein